MERTWGLLGFDERHGWECNLPLNNVAAVVLQRWSKRLRRSTANRVNYGEAASSIIHVVLLCILRKCRGTLVSHLAGREGGGLALLA